MKKIVLLLLLIALLSVPMGFANTQKAHAAGGGSVEVVYSSYNNTDTNNRLNAQPSKPLSAIDNTTANAVITVDPSITYQPWLGFGGSIEHDSIWELNRLSAADKASALDSLFNPATGNNYNLMRLAIACPDFCPDYNSSISPDKGYWTYNDMPAGQTDPNLNHFSIQRDIDMGVISTLQQVLQINPNIKFYASMWSPPAWMKDNGKIVDGGHVLPQYYNALANYYVKYIQDYKAQGIPIYAVTLQNEPDISIGYPSTLWTTDEQMNFAQTLGQTFAANNIKTKIWGLDANEHVTFDYAKNFVNSNSSQYVEGAGFHNYTGQNITQSTSLHYQYPDKTMHLTEITNGAAKLVDYFRNWMSSYTYWLTFIEFMPKQYDTSGNQIGGGGPGPGFWQDTYRDPAQDPDFWVDSQLSWAGAPGNSTYKLNAWYYTFGQFSRYIQAGAVRIDSTGAIGTDVTNVAFKNPDGTIVVIVVNRTPGPNGSNATDSNTSAKTLKIVTPDGQITDTIPGDTVATYKWTSTTGNTLSRSSWTASASNTNGSYTAIQAIDGNANTVWTSGINEAVGHNFTLNLGSVQTFDQVSLNMGTLVNDSPVTYQLFTSSDGVNWGSSIASGSGTNSMTNIIFTSQTKQFIRISLTGSASHWWSIADASVYNSQTGLLPRNGWTATASTTSGSNAANHSLDGNPATRWTNGTAQTSGQSFQIDMAAVRTFNKISIDAGPNQGDQPRGYSVFVSNDGVNWGSAISTGMGIGQDVQVFVPTQTARYIKVNQTGTASNWWSIAEFRVYNAAPSLLNRSGWNATASASESGTTPTSTLDDNLATRWTNGSSQANGQWFQVDMGKINSISGVTLNAASFIGDYPRGYTVDLSIDGTNWQRVASGSSPAQDVMISIPINYARYIKVTQTGSIANWWSIAEVNVFGVETVPTSGTKINHTGWTASASHTETGGNPGVAIDEWLQAARNAPYSDPMNHTASRWTSGKSQTGNEWFQVDMGSTRTFNTLEINSGGSASDYARSFTLYVSNDGVNWTPIASSDGTGPVQRVKFATVNARYFNINQTGTAGQWWSIAEINLYQQ